MRRWLLLTALALAGCKTADRDRKAADPVSRPKPKNWDDGPTPALDRVGTPNADSWADPKDPTYDLDREVRGILAGFVEDPDGRKVRDVFIEVEPVGGAGGGAPVGVQTDRQGHFLIKGLKPKQAYQLTVQTRSDGRDLGGQVYAKTGAERSQFVRVSLIEGLTFPGRPVPAGAGRDRPAQPSTGPAPRPDTPARAPEASIPAPVLPSAGVAPRADGGGGTGLMLPAPADGRTGRTDVEPAAPPVGRPDLNTRTDDLLGRPPAASIPAPPPTVTPPPPPGGPGRSQSRSVRPGAEFTLVDTTGVPRAFPTGRPGELVLLDFMTTACLPCKRAIPAITGLQAKYGTRGLDVVGVACDTVGPAERRAVAARYQRDERLNYLLYVEPGTEPGAVADRFGVKKYPTLVLLDGAGDVLWTGHPDDATILERAIERGLAGGR